MVRKSNVDTAKSRMLCQLIKTSCETADIFAIAYVNGQSSGMKCTKRMRDEDCMYIERHICSEKISIICDELWRKILDQSVMDDDYHHEGAINKWMMNR